MRDVAERATTAAVDALVAQVGQAVVGKERVARLVLATLIAGGHALLVDVPGVAKTRMARALARSLALTHSRVQATPDLLPGDVVGVSVFDPRTQDFRYRPGPVMHHLVLVDEINRATPRTQAALLECMEERQVTVDGVTHPVPEPFMVMATENPVEMEGTYPLPEAQLDRFLIATEVGYPAREEEVAMVDRLAVDDPLDRFQAVAGPEEVLAWQAAARAVRLHPVVQEYLVDVVRATREHSGVRLGASPRAVMGLARMARAWAWMHGRDFVRPEDIKDLAGPVLAHRLMLAADTEVMGKAGRDVVAEVLEQVPVPTEIPQ
jgi:MoxR-like ATPase